jgi:ABC-2 type transport system permease protein
MRFFFAGMFALCRKELKMILKDPRSRMILVMPIIIQSLLFGYAVSFDLNDVPFAILDEDNSTLSRELARRFDASPTFQRAAELRNAADIAPLVDSGRVLIAVSIAADTERRVLAGLSAPIQIIADGRNALTGATAARYATSIVEGFAAEHSGREVPLRLEIRALHNPNLETRNTMLPGLIAALAMLQTILPAALSTAREREQGTFDQLCVTPLSPLAVMIGKALPPMLVGFAQSALIFCVARFWFQIPCAGSLWAISLVLLPLNMALAGLGLIVSVLSRNMQQAMLLCFALIMPIMLLSGLTTPIRAMPELMQRFTLLNPLRYAVDAVRRIYLEGADLSVLLPNLLGLTLIALPSLIIAAWLFRRRA